ncbi:MAG: CxxC motif-containing protein (DUF1111 family)/predicted lipoprotein with Yx(FWY)xxD motif [Flavobacteriales bacterium]|jgi:CxxC motif-containing protein (DUF1111 family)/predicted lipoprotein with Yx(FWY)xxD motif/beta-glucanase (GH16 family)
MKSKNIPVNGNHSSSFIQKLVRPVLTKQNQTIFAALVALCFIQSSNAQVGNLLWEDNFDTFDANAWTVDVGDGCDQGLCGWGNEELQSYGESNVYIEPTPGESGNNALVLEARDEQAGNLVFTSGKIQSKNKVAVKYGMIEYRVLIPSVDDGLWPAVWMLGTNTASWPRNGEIDMMEMGQSLIQRDGAGFPNAQTDNYVGSNVIRYAEDACVPGNESCAANAAWQTDNAYVSQNPLAGRFVTYRTYWTESEIRFTVFDAGVEHDLFENPVGIPSDDPDAEALRTPFYLLMNLAVGGNFTDAEKNDEVTAPRPAKMYVDYIRVYQYNGLGEMILGDTTQPETGTFGVFTDTTQTNNTLEVGVSSDIFVWDLTSSIGNIEPAEGDNVIAWNAKASSWFGGGILARQPVNLSNFLDATLNFKIKIPADVGFRIGVTDTFANENWIDFPAGESTYGMVRNGEWADVSIPVGDLRGESIAMQSIAYPFAVLSLGSLSGSDFELAIDDIRYEGGGDPVDMDSDNDGVLNEFDSCPNTPAGAVVDSSGCELIVVPVDSDNDGVFDFSDACPNTPFGTEVDPQGCALVFDDDNDGVSNAQDLCPGTPVGAAVDNFGCSLVVEPFGAVQLDADSSEFFVNTAAWADIHYIINNGGQLNMRLTQSGGRNALVLNGLSDGDIVEYNYTYWDADGNRAIETAWQAHTHGGVIVGDADNDGVNDNLDQCANTPAGAAVDNVGCPSDSDSDGVLNGLDQCPNTPAGNAVDAQGCTVSPINDSDNDGVLDTVDLCPGTPAGTVVGATGCAVVSQVFGAAQLDSHSAEFFVNTSSWADIHYTVNGGGQLNMRLTLAGGRNALVVNGLADGNVVAYNYTYWDTAGNRAIETAWQNYTHGGTVVLDDDNDGVVNGDDLCPGTPAGTPVNAQGCALVLDDDNDGVVNGDDLCPGTPAGTPVNAQGCALVLDDDNDGVVNGDDLCPGTPAGTPVNAAGCQIVSQVFGATQLDSASVELFVNTTAWADIHYTVNGGGQLNMRMTQLGGRNNLVVNGLANGNVIQYSYTYWDTAGNTALDSGWQTYTHGGTTVGDADNDGVNDDIDECPGTLAGTNVNSVGCPVDVNDPDADSDGVVDSVDECPGTPAGTAVDNVGCPIVTANKEVSVIDDILVGGPGSSKPGFSLYTFDNDSNGESSCYTGCEDNWPPVLVTDGRVNGTNNLGTTDRNDGSVQATYNGMPLYFFKDDIVAGDKNGDGAGNVWHIVEIPAPVLGDIIPLYDQSTPLNAATSFVRDDGVLVTRVADRGRDRHAKDNTNQDHYDHYLAHYWEQRTARIQIEDYTPLGQSLLRISFVSETQIGAKEFRAWYMGDVGTPGKFFLNPNPALIVPDGSGTFDDELNKISDQGGQHKYVYEMIKREGASSQLFDIGVGENMEFEMSQFLLNPDVGRNNYYGTSYVYVTGQLGLHAFEWERGSKDGVPITADGLLGGDTTIGYNYSEEPAGRFMVMPTNLAPEHGQDFVLGRRVHHTSFDNGQHDEHTWNVNNPQPNLQNPIWTEQIGKVDNHYVNDSCASCHVRNGRALLVEPGEKLEKWVFKIGDENGNPDPNIGRVLQPETEGSASSEGSVRLGAWTEETNGLRSPNYIFEGVSPASFSARIAPNLVGLGLLEAVSEETILEWEDADDINADGISGRASLGADPFTGEVRLGRFGYKASTTSVLHQVAGAFNTDMGVLTSVLPDPDCGVFQTDCEASGSEIDDLELDRLVKYISLLGVPARRNYNDKSGENIFHGIGCVDCHRAEMQTSAFHPFTELRDQTIHAYTDMLLHDMGDGLADNLGEGTASGREWRTAPLWGIGHTAAVLKGDLKAIDDVTIQQQIDVTTGQRHQPSDELIGYLHDGRARNLDEAIRWHGGEAEAAVTAYDNLNSSDEQALITFLESL